VASEGDALLASYLQRAAGGSGMRRGPSFFAVANGGDAVAVFEEVARHLLDCDGSFPLRTTGSCRSRLDLLVAALNNDDLQPPFSEPVEVLATALLPLGPGSSTRAARRPRRGGGVVLHKHGEGATSLGQR
jgi:hypothetical protein